MRDWIAQATEADLEQLEALCSAGPTDPARPAGERWTAKTLGDVAQFFGLALQTVKEWRVGPEPMPGNEGAWPLPEIVRWRIARLERSLRGPSTKAERELEQLDIANRRMRLKLRKESGELVDRAAAKTAVRQLFHRLRGQLQPLPEFLSTAVPAQSRADFLFDARARIQQLLTSISSWQFDQELPNESPTADDTPDPA